MWEVLLHQSTAGAVPEASIDAALQNLAIGNGSSSEDWFGHISRSIYQKTTLRINSILMCWKKYILISTQKLAILLKEFSDASNGSSPGLANGVVKPQKDAVTWF